VKLRMSCYKYSVLSSRLRLIALGIMFIGALVHTILAYAHMDYIGPEGATNAIHDQEEANKRESNQAPTVAEQGQIMKDAVDRAIRDYDREQQERSERDSNNNNDRSDNYESGGQREPSRGAKER
jgi:hypothetical protein